MDRARKRQRLTYAKEVTGLGRDYRPWPAQVGIDDQTILCGSLGH